MYYLAIIQNFGESNSLFPFNTFEEALAAYHTELAYRAEGRKSTRCAILNGDLQMLRQETYIVPNTDNTEEPVEG